MPTPEEKQQILNSKAEPPRVAPGWNGPKEDPNFDWNGKWKHGMPDPDKPVNEMYNAAKVGDKFTEFPYGEWVTDEDIAKWQLRLDVEAGTRTLTAFTRITDMDLWRKEFTRECDELGFIVNYNLANGDIHLPVQGMMFTEKQGIPATESALAWLGAERVKAAKKKRAEEAREARNRAEAEAVADPISNPANFPATLAAIMARLEAIERKIDAV
jgi:hypothetical protein